MRIFRFRLGSSVFATLIVAILTFPAYKFVTGSRQSEKESQQDFVKSTNDKDGPATIQLPAMDFDSVSTVVFVPDGGTVITGGHTIRPDGTMWVNGKMIREKDGRRLDENGNRVLSTPQAVKDQPR